MAGDFIGVLQGSITLNTSTSTPLTIPTKTELLAAGFPEGQPLVIRVVAVNKSAFKVGKASDAASKTLASGYLPKGNLYAYGNAIETYKVTSVTADSTPTTIHGIAVTTGGDLDVAFGYYI